MKQRAKSRTSSRKKDHVLLAVKRDVAFRQKRNGFDEWEFVHNALPELNLSEISTETLFLSKRLSFPFMISCMTGGYADAKRINRNLAEVCEERRIAMGVGSQRQALEDETYRSSFSVVREVAGSIPIVGNIGAAEVAQFKDVAPVQRLADLLRADERRRIGEIAGHAQRVRPDADLEEVARLMTDYDLSVVPVVDEEDRLLGVITVDDVLELVLPRGWRRRFGVMGEE